MLLISHCHKEQLTKKHSDKETFLRRVYRNKMLIDQWILMLVIKIKLYKVVYISKHMRKIHEMKINIFYILCIYYSIKLIHMIINLYYFLFSFTFLITMTSLKFLHR